MFSYIIVVLSVVSCRGLLSVTGTCTYKIKMDGEHAVGTRIESVCPAGVKH